MICCLSSGSDKSILTVFSFSSVEIDIKDEQNGFQIISKCNSSSKTGVEMEALLSVTVTALTIYDMCKSIDKSIEIKKIRLLSKKGGKSGNYIR